MSQASLNLSDRLFFTVDYCDGTARFGELAGKQPILLSLSKKELINLALYLKRFDISGVVPDIEEDTIKSFVKKHWAFHRGPVKGICDCCRCKTGKSP
jgi:hypothetical protein